MSNTPLSVRKFLFAFAAWWFTWAAFHTWMLYSLGYSIALALTDSCITNFLLALTCVLASNSMQYYLPRKDRYWYILLVSLALSTLWVLSIHYILPLVIEEESDYYDLLSKSLPVRFGIAVLLIACMEMISILWYSFEEQKATSKRKTDAEQLSKDAELYKLRTQLQPHFLFNSLNSINALIGLKPDEARRMVQQLSEFLRGTLRREEHQWIPLEEELQHLRLYLEIEKVRFGNRLSTEFAVQEDSLKMKIPAMLLQPLVENAIKFGLYDTTGETVISVEAKAEDGLLAISVQNPFDPETATSNKGTGFGLSSIQRRLYLLFARNDLINTRADGNIFTTILKVPQL